MPVQREASSVCLKAAVEIGAESVSRGASLPLGTINGSLVGCSGRS